MKLTKFFVAALVLTSAFASMLVMTGCETAKGFGRDVEDTGRSIQHEAQ